MIYARQIAPEYQDAGYFMKHIRKENSGLTYAEMNVSQTTQAKILTA